MRPDSPATKDDVNSAMQAVMDEILAVKEEILVVKDDVQAVKDDLQGVKDDVQGVKDDVQGVKDDVQGVKDDVGTLKALTLGSPDPDQHNYVIFPIGGSYLGSCSGCSWQRGARVEGDIHGMFQEHHSEFLDGWQASDAGGSAG